MAFPSADLPAADVLVLLCSYNGADWLAAQLDSIAAQQGCSWALWISDDGSTDASLAVIEAFRARHPGHDIRLLQGPRQELGQGGSGGGAAQNFLWLLCHPDLPLGPQSHVALCDQDDIWLPHKLARGLARLRAEADAASSSIAGPLIYGAQSWHIDSAGRRIGKSRRPRRPVLLQNAVVQNMVSGHSLMLNPAALALARQAGRPAGIAFQDWWLSFLVLACGGRAVIDTAEVLLYRQHGRNVMGAPGGMVAALLRLRLLFGGRYRRWLNANLAGLQAAAMRPDPVQPSPEAARILAALLPAQSPLARLRQVWRLRLYRQGALGTALFYAAVLLGLA